MIRSAMVLAVLIAAMSMLDRFLAKTDMAEVQHEARRSYMTGSRLLDQGKAAQAVEPLRNAHVLDRQNPEYELQLGNALLVAGRTAEAEPLINETLQREPNDGQANLVAARLTARQRLTPEAEAYYHRAIYGDWPARSAEHRVAARMELIELLVREGKRPKLLPELISLEAENEGGVEMQKRLAHLFLMAGAPARAANVYRAMVASRSSDAEAWEGLGEAELEQGQYRAARTAFLKASLADPKAPVQPRLELLNAVTALDPTPRQLPSMEKYRRGIRILAEVRDDLRQRPSAETNQLLKEADEALSKKEPTHMSNEVAEEVLALAEKLWQFRIGKFGAAVPPAEEPLRLVMDRLAG